MVSLRDYQATRADEATAALLRGEHCAIVIPTGTGKTRTALEVVRRVTSTAGARGEALWLVDLKALVSQTQRAAADAGVAVRVRTIQGVRAVAPGDYDMIVVDEAHKFLTERRLEILRAADTPILGLTATPRRGDGRHIAELFGERPVGGPYTLGEAIDDGWLADCRVLRVELQELDLTAVKQTRVDFDSKALAEALNTETHNSEIVRRWREVATEDDGRPMITAFFAVDIAHAEALAAEVDRQLGEGTCVTIHSKLPDAAERVEQFRAGRWRVAASVMMVAEGFDYPALRCGVLARPTKSDRLLVQMLGRVLRPHEDKPWALLLDCQGAYERLDLATIYDVVDQQDTADTPALTEPAPPEEMDDVDDIPMLSEVVSRLRAIDIFRREVAAARTLPWVSVDEMWVLPLDRAWLMVGRSKYVPNMVAVCVGRYHGHRAICRVLDRAAPEAAAFRDAEAFARSEAPSICWTRPHAMEVVRGVRQWLKDRGPLSDGSRAKLLAFGVPEEQLPTTHGEGRAMLRRFYARGRR